MKKNKLQNILIVVTAFVVIAGVVVLATTSKKPQMKLAVHEAIMAGDVHLNGKGLEEENENTEPQVDLTKRAYLTKDGFKPRSLSIDKGEEIHITNMTDAVIQLYTKSDRHEIIRKLQQPKETRIFKFDKSGRLDVIDVFNQSAKFTLTVNRK